MSKEEPQVKPIYCDPEYVIHDTFVPRYVPVIHPVIHVTRKNIVNVPKHIVKESGKTEIVDPGYPDKCDACDRRRRSCFDFWF
ncbi:MAG: spore coat protein D [Sporolactobacillus sp.]|nr:spore coat protein D [Sporolactobacillus sp.]